MIKEAIEFIIGQSRPEIITVDGREYMLPEYAPAREPIPSSIETHTLTGLIDYLNHDIDETWDREDLFIHVIGHDKVELKSSLFGRFEQRATLISCDAYDYRKPTWMPVEDFIIHLNADYVRDYDYEYLAKLAAGITQAATREAKDNGVTQTVTVKNGISLVGEQAIKNPVQLQPYRTFPEVEQPVIDFTFRIREQNGHPMCNLFESDGNRWRLETIKAWIEAQLNVIAPTIPVIA